MARKASITVTLTTLIRDDETGLDAADRLLADLPVESVRLSGPGVQVDVPLPTEVGSRLVGVRSDQNFMLTRSGWIDDTTGNRVTDVDVLDELLEDGELLVV